MRLKLTSSGNDTLDFEIATIVGTATIRSAWIVLTAQDVLRLTSCYVL